MRIKDRIKAAREFSGLTREQLAGRLKVRYETVRQWEEGDIQPRPQRYATIAQITGVRRAWLASGEGSMIGDSETPPSAAEITRLAKMLTREERLDVAAELLASARKDAAP